MLTLRNRNSEKQSILSPSISYLNGNTDAKMSLQMHLSKKVLIGKNNATRFIFQYNHKRIK